MVGRRGQFLLHGVDRVQGKLHSGHHSSSSSRPAHLTDLLRDLMHREDVVWGLLLGVPSGHRVHRELSQQEL
ncbi:hypothetical protein KI387_027619, partial [Taxus chinensis]